MTIHGGGSPILMSEINAEFGRGNDLNAYRGVPWWTDANEAGTFSAGQISMWEFYGKRATPPIIPGVAEFTWLGKNAPGNINVGADHPDRYVLFVAADRVASGGTPNITKLTINGAVVPLTQGVNGNGLYSEFEDILNQESFYSAIGFAHAPTGATLNVGFNLENGNSRNVNFAMWKLIGPGLRIVGAKKGRAGTAQGMEFGQVPDRTAVVGVVCADKQSPAAWGGGLTRNWNNDFGGYQVDYGSGMYSAGVPAPTHPHGFMAVAVSS